MLMLPQILVAFLLGLILTKAEEKPTDLDQEAESYEYDYVINGDKRIAQGKEERRNLKVVSERYNVQEGKSSQSVEYITDDGSYHPHIEQRGSSDPLNVEDTSSVNKVVELRHGTEKSLSINSSVQPPSSTTETTKSIGLNALNQEDQNVMLLDETDENVQEPCVTEQIDKEANSYIIPNSTNNLNNAQILELITNLTLWLTPPNTTENVFLDAYPNDIIDTSHTENFPPMLNFTEISLLNEKSLQHQNHIKPHFYDVTTVNANKTYDTEIQKEPDSEIRPNALIYKDISIPHNLPIIDVLQSLMDLEHMGGYGNKLVAKKPPKFKLPDGIEGLIDSHDILDINQYIDQNVDISSIEDASPKANESSSTPSLLNEPIVVQDIGSESMTQDKLIDIVTTMPPSLVTEAYTESIRQTNNSKIHVVVEVHKGIDHYLGEIKYDNTNGTSNNILELDQRGHDLLPQKQDFQKYYFNKTERVNVTESFEKNNESNLIENSQFQVVGVPHAGAAAIQPPTQTPTALQMLTKFPTNINNIHQRPLLNDSASTLYFENFSPSLAIEKPLQFSEAVDKPLRSEHLSAPLNQKKTPSHFIKPFHTAPLAFKVPPIQMPPLVYAPDLQDILQQLQLVPVDNRIPVQSTAFQYVSTPYSIPLKRAWYNTVQNPTQHTVRPTKSLNRPYIFPQLYPTPFMQNVDVLAEQSIGIPVKVPLPSIRNSVGKPYSSAVNYQSKQHVNLKIPCIDLRYFGYNKPICTNYIGMIPPTLSTHEDRTNHQRSARQNFEETVRYEYGFKPPLIPSLRIDEQGNPVDDQTK